MLICFVDGTVDAVVFGTGTGGTLAGINTLSHIFVPQCQNYPQIVTNILLVLHRLLCCRFTSSIVTHLINIPVYRLYMTLFANKS